MSNIVDQSKDAIKYKQANNKSLSKMKLIYSGNPNKSMLHHRINSDVIYYENQLHNQLLKKDTYVRNTNAPTHIESNESNDRCKLIKFRIKNNPFKISSNATTNTNLKYASYVNNMKPVRKISNMTFYCKKDKSINQSSNKLQGTFIKRTFDNREKRSKSNFATERNSFAILPSETNKKANLFKIKLPIKKLPEAKKGNLIFKNVNSLLKNIKDQSSNMTMPSTIVHTPTRKSIISRMGFNVNPGKAVADIELLQQMIKDSNIKSSKFYKIGKTLGKGAFGKVSLGIHKLSGKKVAIKTIKKEFLEDKDAMSKFLREVEILKTINHPSIIQFMEQFETKKHYCLVLELCTGGDLLSYVRKRKRLREEQAKFFFRQIIEGIASCHSKNILHRDIKLDNILFNTKGLIKIADFGVSIFVKPNHLMHEQSGTPAYIAPEVIKDEGYKGFASDIWSCGIVLYALLYGTVPFKAGNINDLKMKIIASKYKLKEGLSKDAYSLLKAVLEPNPTKRFTINQILEHPWMKNSCICNIPTFVASEIEGQEKDLSEVNKDESKVISDNNNFEDIRSEECESMYRNDSLKSIVLAPYNSILDESFKDDVELREKNAIKFTTNVIDYDKQYEINNNFEVDNGVYNKLVCESVSSDQSIVGMEEFGCKLTPHSLLKYEVQASSLKIREDIVSIIESFGFKREFILQSLEDNVRNHATASYYILLLT